VQDSNGRLVSDVAQVNEGDDLRITFAHGWGKVELKEKGHSS
jgi:exonuclease VII large subunit